MDNIVIEKNNMMILSGLTEFLLVNWLNTSFIGANENDKSRTAPSRAINQYVLNLIFPSLIVGKNKIDRVINMNVITEITIVGIIINRYYALI